MESPFQPDYKTTTEALYMTITLRLLEELPRLSTLSFAAHPLSPRATRNTPSWVPNYAALLGFTPLIHIGDGKVFDACRGQSKLILKLDHEARGLLLRGISSGLVSHVLPADWARTSAYSNADCALEWLRACQKLQTRHIPPGQSKIEVLWRTLMADTTERSPRIHPAPENYGAHFRQWMTDVLVEGVMTATPRRQRSGLRRLLSAMDELLEQHGNLPCLPTRQDIEACFVRNFLSISSAEKLHDGQGVFLFQSAFKEVSPK
ncbi:hypothetical protein EJ08DRAFT_703511 [Tothia fuscella]|uniref:Uncharacterized protein n=1 Tax=Tothia fuscella TaxID=1048955 RepID=A0A9P4TSQ0_9PEZI|nr:hypothetical protein EJ08DRAFT_703511 [Tothia fuscella]